MAASGRPSTSYSYTTATTTYPSYPDESTETSRPGTSYTKNKRPSTARADGRPRTRGQTALSTAASKDQQIICAISESRGISPIVGLAFVNITNTEAVLSQISDNQTYVRTIHKLWVFQPSEILFMNTATQPKSKMFSIIEANLPTYLPSSRITIIDRKYWSENTGIEYIQNLAFKEDVEAIKVSVGGNFYATCCIAAVLKYIELQLSFTFSFHSLRTKYEPPEGSMMIDLSTIKSLELIQNLQNAKSKDCLFGVLDQTLTPMGGRLLKSNVLQPLIDAKFLEERYEAVQELTMKEDMFFAVRQALKALVDVDRVLTSITIIPTKPSIQHYEQSINQVLLLKQYVKSIPPIHEALQAAESKLLLDILERCAPAMIADVQALIDSTINEDTAYSKKPLELRYQRTYAIQAGVNGLLDVARQTFQEASTDAFQLTTNLGQIHNLNLDLKFENARQYYIRIDASQLENRDLPDVFINVFRRKKVIECQTLDLLKLSQKIADSHNEVLQMSDRTVQTLIDNVREDIAPLFKICDAIALLDMLSAFTQLATSQDYVRPELIETLAVRDGRHAIREKIHRDKFIPNDVYATQQTRFQIITGCNMSGKSTYIRSIAIMAVMAQIGSFVPASYASFPIFHQLFARISMDDSIEANVSTFASEMREAAFILRNVDKRSMVIVDELGRGTGTRDGLCIAIAIAEALVDSRALVWFATHFRDLATILSERNGVVSLHLSVDMTEPNTIRMLYKIAQGCVQEEHYGLALAKTMDMPEDVIRIAEEVSTALVKSAERRKKASKSIAIARRRKLILGLKEQLTQARDGNMQGNVLATWLQKLQAEFVKRMAAVNADIESAIGEESDDETISQMNTDRLESNAEPIVIDSSDEGPSQGEDGGRMESSSLEQSVQPMDIDQGSSVGGYEMTGALMVEDE